MNFSPLSIKNFAMLCTILERIDLFSILQELFSCYFLVKALSNLTKASVLTRTISLMIHLINVANWPIFRPQNSKPAQQKSLQPRKFSGLESGLILLLCSKKKDNSGIEIFKSKTSTILCGCKVFQSVLKMVAA
jgi:hypothetical protein